jgi:hypothetical protein
MSNIEDAVQTAIVHLKNGELDIAGDILFSLWLNDKSNPDLLILNARVAMAANQNQRAMQFLTTAEALAPHSADKVHLLTTIERYKISINGEAVSQPAYRTNFEAWLRTNKNQSIRPILDGDFRFAIFFNAHCANGTLWNWYFGRMGLVSAITLMGNVNKAENTTVISDYNSAMHLFRLRTFYDSEYYKDCEAQYLEFVNGESDHKWRSFKFVRNPYRRVLGVYLMHMREKIQTYGTTFRSFIAALEKEELDRIDKHFRPQKYSYEEDGQTSFDAVFKIEDGMADHLGSLIKRVSSEKPGSNTINLETRNFTEYSDENGDCVADLDFAGEVFDNKKAPKITQFFDDVLIEQVYHLYKDDFETYGYHYGEF